MAWEDVAARSLGGQAPRVTAQLTSISASYDWSPYIYEAVGVLNGGNSDGGWIDPSRGSPSGITDIIVQRATQHDPAAVDAGFASVRPILEANQAQENNAINAEQATHGDSGIGSLLLLAAAAAAAIVAGPEAIAALSATGPEAAAAVTAAEEGGAVAITIDGGTAASATEGALTYTALDATAGAVATNAELSAAIDAATKIAATATTTAAAGAIAEALAPLKEFFSPVTSALSALSSFNKDVLQPIISPISSTITTISSLVQILDRDIKAGFKGLLSAPTDLANALGSLDATWTRAFAQLDAAQRVNVQDVLVPGLVGDVPGALGETYKVLRGALASARGRFTPLPSFTLAESPDLATFKAQIEHWQEEIAANDSLPALFAQIWLRAIGVAEGLVIQREPFVETWREEMQKNFPTRKLDAATLQVLRNRGSVGEDQAREELRVQGFDAQRADALVSLRRTLIGLGDALSLFRRGWIDNVVTGDMLAAQGMIGADAELLMNSGYVEIDLASLQALVNRRYFSPEEASVALQRQGFRPFDADHLVSLRVQVLGLQDWITREDRSAFNAGGAGFTFASQSPPESFVASASVLGVPPDGAAILWSNHWAMLSPQLAVMAFFRGKVTREQLVPMLIAGAVPVELHDLYIELQRPIVPARSIASQMATKTISPVDGMRILRQHGFDDINANYLIESGVRAHAPHAGAVAKDLHGLSSGVVLELYDGHQITHEEATTLLTELGWAPQAVTATLTFHEVRNEGRERAAKIDLIIADAKAGLIDFATAQGQLSQLDLHATESARALARLTTATSQRTKLPGEAKILAMFKHSLIDEATTLLALGQLGYSDSWAQLLISLEGFIGAKPPKPAKPV